MKSWLQILGSFFFDLGELECGCVQSDMQNFAAKEGVKRLYDAWIDDMAQAEKRCHG